MNDLEEKKRGLWANIHAKRKRGEKMRRPGEKGAPTDAAFRAAQESFRTGETAERQSSNPNDSSSRFDGTTSLANTYKKATPGQTIKRVVREQLDLEEAKYQGRSVPLGKPMKGDVKKSKVYVKNEKGNVVKVEFGDPKLSIKSHIPARKKSYCARSAGQGNANKKTSANYWSRKAWKC